MRIISGKYKSKRIVPPKNFNARPTTDFAKESLFNILVNSFDLEDVSVLDLFSGTGGISFEFASRGCVDVTAIEMNPVHLAFIKRTIDELGLEHCRAYRAEVFRFIKSCKRQFDIIFADPPYEMKGIEQIPDLIFKGELLKPGGLLIVEHSARVDISHLKYFREVRNYSQVHFSFFSLE